MSDHDRSSGHDQPPRPVIVGCAGPRLSAEEARVFAAFQPLGFILFGRNIESPDQLRRLIAELRGCVGRDQAPVLVDQEGGRVARLGPPHWKLRPPASRFGILYDRDPEAAVEAARLNAGLIGVDLAELGITVDCAPVLDVPSPDGHQVIGDRALSAAPEAVARLGRAVCAGLSDGGVVAVVKHIPGHGRARADSHLALPVVDAPIEALRAVDFLPFRALADVPVAMTAHVTYRAVDEVRPATVSPVVIERVIRGEIGFHGVLLSDDLAMKALSGAPGMRARAALAAGCDVALYCPGALDELGAVFDSVPPMAEAAWQRVARAFAPPPAAPRLDRGSIQRRLDALLATGEGVVS